MSQSNDQTGQPLGALVFASSYTALGIVRSLGRHGIPVWVLGERFSLSAVSRYAKRTIHMQGQSEAEQVAFLLWLAHENQLTGWALFPDSDKSVALIGRNQQALGEYYKLTSPSWDVVEWAFDKKRTYQLAEELKIDYPKTFYPLSHADVEKLDGAFPMILKPANHQGLDRFSIISGAWRASDRAELLSLYDEASDAVGGKPIITVQEMIPGGGEAQFSYTALCDKGRVLACVTAQRKRLLPVDFGASAYVVTIADIPEMEDASRRWLERVNYSGLVEVEFKYHAGTGHYKLLDVNARAWGWHVLCRFAGVDYPYLMWKLVQGEPVEPVRGRAGVRWMRTAYDAMSALQLIRRGTLSLGDYLESIRGAHQDVFLLDDLMPVVFEVPLLFKLIWNKLRGR